jgi:hypothetical protein
LYGSGAEGNLWGIPAANGSLQAVEPVPEWLPTDFLPQYLSSNYEINIDGLLSSITDQLTDVGTILNMMQISLDGLNLVAEVTLPPVESPIPLPLWISNLNVDLMIAISETDDPTTIPPWEWKHPAELGGDSWQPTELNDYRMWPGYAGRPNQPYNLSINTIKVGEINWPEPVTLPTLRLEIDLLMVLGEAIGLLFGGGGTIWISLYGIQVFLEFPTELGYVLPLELTEFMEPEDLYIPLAL